MFREDVIVDNLSQAKKLMIHHILEHKTLGALISGFLVAVVAMQELVEKHPNIPERNMMLDDIFHNFPGLREHVTAINKEGRPNDQGN